MNRRQFIKWSAGGIVIAGGFPMFSSLSELRTVAREKFPKNVDGLEDVYADILYFACLAPSGHNTQPWTVKFVTDNQWVIGTDPARWLTVVDPDNRETIISIGAFLENLIVAANAKNYTVEVNIIAQNTKDKDIVEIRLHKATQANVFNLQNIALRRTVRNNLLTSALANEDLASLIGENQDSFFYYRMDTTAGKSLTEMTLAANKVQTYQNAAQEELAKWVRWSNREIQQFGNGLTAETMEIDGIARWYVKNFYSSQAVLENNFREETIKKIQEQVAAGSGWLLITSKNSSVAELIQVGRKLQRMWLGARERKIAIHPMNQMIEDVAMRSELSSTLKIAGDVQLLLKVGYINYYPQPVSPRMSLQNIIL